MERPPDRQQQISTLGRRAEDIFTIKELKEILQYFEPEATTPKKLKDKIKFGLLKLPMVVQSLKTNEVASAAAFPKVPWTPVPAGDQPMPPAPAAPLQPPATA